MDTTKGQFQLARMLTLLFLVITSLGLVLYFLGTALIAGLGGQTYIWVTDIIPQLVAFNYFFNASRKAKNSSMSLMYAGINFLLLAVSILFYWITLGAFLVWFIGRIIWVLVIWFTLRNQKK